MHFRFLSEGLIMLSTFGQLWPLAQGLDGFNTFHLEQQKPQMLSRTPGAGSLLVATLFAAAPRLSSATLKAWKGAEDSWRRHTASFTASNSWTKYWLSCLSWGIENDYKMIEPLGVLQLENHNGAEQLISWLGILSNFKEFEGILRNLKEFQGIFRNFQEF